MADDRNDTFKKDAPNTNPAEEAKGAQGFDSSAQMNQRSRGLLGSLVLVMDDWGIVIGIGIFVHPPQRQPQPEVSAHQSFDVVMPEVCPAGCHRVILRQDGRQISLGRVRNAPEAVDLVTGWGRTHRIEYGVMRRLRAQVVDTTARYNEELAAQQARR